MCGIAGYFGSKRINSDKIHGTLELMKRRGPNGQKFVEIPVTENKRCYLLHSRLSIIDLDHRSDQPFHYKDKTIVFNGEIYNFIEVKQELEKLGHQFITASDTEVLIHALDEWGEAAFNKIEGMWAFALYNHTEKSLFLSRDPFGEKPLYIYEPEPGELYFGSEIKFIRSLYGLPFSIDNAKIANFLANGYKSVFKNSSTFFKEVKRFTPASFTITSPNGRTKEQRYWNPKTHLVNNKITIDEAIGEIKEKLIQTIFEVDSSFSLSILKPHPS